MSDIALFFSILFAICVLAALISVGNERQRKAIDGIRRQAALWAAEDLRIKRGKVSQKIEVPDPAAWLDGIMNRVTGISPGVLRVDPFNEDGLRALVAVGQDGHRWVLSPLPKKELLKTLAGRKKKSNIEKMKVGLLGRKPRSVPVIELTVVNAGVFFDLEAQQIWRTFFTTNLGTDHLYLYTVPKKEDA